MCSTIFQKPRSYNKNGKRMVAVDLKDAAEQKNICNSSYCNICSSFELKTLKFIYSKVEISE